MVKASVLIKVGHLVRVFLVQKQGHSLREVFRKMVSLTESISCLKIGSFSQGIYKDVFLKMRVIQ